MGNEIKGFFLSFSDKEMEDLNRRLDLFGYTADGEGLKKLVMDSLCDMEEDDDGEVSPTDSVINNLKNYLNKNPETVMMGVAAVKGLSNMLKRRKGK